MTPQHFEAIASLDTETRERFEHRQNFSEIQSMLLSVFPKLVSEWFLWRKMREGNKIVLAREEKKREIETYAGASFKINEISKLYSLKLFEDFSINLYIFILAFSLPPADTANRIFAIKEF